MKPESPVTFTPETAADAWMGLLAMRGVDYLFANGGTDFAPVVEAYAKGEKLGWRLPEIVIVPHENMGIAMAHGYAMVTGRPQIVMVHVVVGTANALGGIINDQTIPQLKVDIVAGGANNFGTLSAAVLFDPSRARRTCCHRNQPHESRDLGIARPHGPSPDLPGASRSIRLHRGLC